MFFQLIVITYILNYVFTSEPVIYYLSTFDGKEDKSPIFDDYASGINFDVPLVIIIHGWIQSSDDGHYVDLTKAYNRLGKNVINMDWDVLASEPYFQAVASTKIVGDHGGKFIVNLLGYGMDPSKLHIVGHSLGAQIAGFMGKHLKKFARKRVGRITGLDPAGWGFYKLPLHDDATRRLDKDDADLVVVLNTSFLYGIGRSVGRVTFYANHGIFQPGCPFDDDPNTKPLFCSHQRSMSYMIESLYSDNFVGRKSCHRQKTCQNRTLIFNENIPCKSEGIYNFYTNVKEPYGKGVTGGVHYLSMFFHSNPFLSTLNNTPVKL